MNARSRDEVETPAGSTTRALDSMPAPRRGILVALKGSGPLAIADLAERIGVTYEAARQHLTQVELEGWVERNVDRGAASPGRPRSLYRLTTAGDHLFPKQYDSLAVTLLDAAADRLGPEALHSLLEEVARRKVEHWEALLAGASFEERLQALTDVYLAGDPFCRVEHDRQGRPLLIEMNCPYLEVARRRPALCSVTVSVLRRLLGRDVVRSERFQAGDGRCVFRVLDERRRGKERPLFDWESDPTEAGDHARGTARNHDDP